MHRHASIAAAHRARLYPGGPAGPRSARPALDPLSQQRWLPQGDRRWRHRLPRADKPAACRAESRRYPLHRRGGARDRAAHRHGGIRRRGSARHPHQRCLAHHVRVRLALGHHHEPRDHARLPIVRARGRDLPPRSQGRRHLPADHRWQVRRADAPDAAVVQPHLRDLDRLQRRPAPLGRSRDARAAALGTVGRATHRRLGGAGPHRSRLARAVSRRGPEHDVRDGRAAAGPRRPTEGHRAVAHADPRTDRAVRAHRPLQRHRVLVRPHRPWRRPDPHVLRCGGLGHRGGGFRRGRHRPLARPLARRRRAPRDRLMLRRLARLTRPVENAGGRVTAIAVYADAAVKTFPATDLGYEGVACVDDAARAVVLLCDLWATTRLPPLRTWAEGLAEFLLYMQREDGTFVNFITDWKGTRNESGPTSHPGGAFWNARGARALAKLWMVLGDERAHEGLRLALPAIRESAGVPPDVRAIHAHMASDLLRVGTMPQLRGDLERWSDELAGSRRGSVLLDNPDQTEPHLWAHIQEGVLAEAGALLHPRGLLAVARASALAYLAPIVESAFDLPTG